MKFNGDPKQLAFFLTQVWTDMQEYGANLPNNQAIVRIITMALEDETGEWIVALHDDAAELHNFDRFMAVLRKRFEDSLAD